MSSPDFGATHGLFFNNVLDKCGKIYLIPSPIAERDVDLIISNQIRQVISLVDVFFVENIRTSRRFVSALSLGLDIEKLRFEVLDKDTAEQELESMLSKVTHGAHAGILSEAGCPGVADPGARLVALAHERKVEVVPLAGPSSIVMALMASGFCGQSFTFHGYVPTDRKVAQDKLKKMEREANLAGTTQIFMDTPYRNNQLLDLLASTCSRETLLCVARDISGENELIRTNTINVWKTDRPDLHKKPTVFLLGK